MIPATNLDFLWNTLVRPRLGIAPYDWGRSFDPGNIRQGTDCSGAVSAELSALVRGPGMIYGRQFWTGTFAGISPGDTGPFENIADTEDLVCIAHPTDVPADYAMLIAIIQTGPDPGLADQAHMICRVGGVDIEMGGNSDNYHTSVTDSTCASATDTGEFNQWFYLPGPAGNLDFAVPPYPDLVASQFL